MFFPLLQGNDAERSGTCYFGDCAKESLSDSALQVGGEALQPWPEVKEMLGSVQGLLTRRPVWAEHSEQGEETKEMRF